jgi:hypothetical protein
LVEFGLIICFIGFEKSCPGSVIIVISGCFLNDFGNRIIKDCIRIEGGILIGFQFDRLGFGLVENEDDASKAVGKGDPGIAWIVLLSVSSARYDLVSRAAPFDIGGL